MASSSDLLLTGVGAITALGRSAQAAAAHRAGVVRAHPLPHCPVPGLDLSEVPATGRPIRGHTEGFVQAGLWCRLALGALNDLLGEDLPRAADFWQRTLLVACLPHPEPARFTLPREGGTAAIADTFFTPLLAATGLAVPPDLRIVTFGHGAVAAALQRAPEWFRSQPALQRILVLAVDSYTDPQSLGWLLADGRLHTDAHADGLIPGEAGAAALFERPESAAARRATTLGRLATMSIHVSTGSPTDSPAALGARLAEGTRLAMESSDGGSECDVYVDLNGESWRAQAWGLAQVALQKANVLPRLRPRYPGTGFGELGAAAAGVAIVLASEARDRGYAAPGGAVVTSVDERNGTAAFALLPP